MQRTLQFRAANLPYIRELTQAREIPLRINANRYPERGQGIFNIGLWRFASGVVGGGYRPQF
jgi:hypothetical protein